MLLEYLHSTKTDRTEVVVVSNGPERFPKSKFADISVVHIGNIPTIPIAVNFGWYAKRRPNTILVKLDKDIEPPPAWEREILEKSEKVGLGGFTCTNDVQILPRKTFDLNGALMRRPHTSEIWGTPCIYSQFMWISAIVAEKLQYEDERFIRADDNELGERVDRLGEVIQAYSGEYLIKHLAPGLSGSTEPDDLVTAMYDACDRLGRSLPPRPITQDTIWRQVITQADAAALVDAQGKLPENLEVKAREILRSTLIDTYKHIGAEDVVIDIFKRV